MLRWQLSLLLFPFMCVPASLPAQQRDQRVAPRPPAKGGANDDELLRLQAIALLNTLDQSAGDIKDVAERVRVLAEIGDALWTVDEEHARAVLTRSFEEVDKLTAGSEADRERVSSRAEALRRMVLTRVAKHDTALAKQLIEGVSSAPPSAEQKWKQMYGASPPSGDALLSVANNLLASDPKRAAAVAGYTLGEGLTQKLRLFLISLRAKDKEAANALVSAALSAASTQHPARLFDVLVLWDYTYQPPSFYLGGISWSREKEESPYVAPAALKRAVLKFAVSAILENIQQTLGSRETGTERAVQQAQPALLYSVIQQLLPTIQADLPEGAAALQAGLANVEQELRLTNQKLPERPPSEESPEESADAVEKLLERAPDAPTAEARDDLYLGAAFKLLQQRQIERAAEVAAKIEDQTRRAMIAEPISFNLAGELIEKGRLDEALTVTRKLTAPELRVAALAKIGKGYFDREELVRGYDYLNEAQALAGKSEPTVELCAATLSVASALAKRDAPRAFEVAGLAIGMMEKIKAEESLWALMSPSGSSGPLAISNFSWKRAANGGLKSVKASYPRPAGLAEVLSQVSRFDFGRAVSLTRQIQPKGLALAVQAAICRSSLQPAGVKTSRRQG
jgi:hypothetical protein